MRPGDDYVHWKSYQLLRSRWQAGVASAGNPAHDLDGFPWFVSKISKSALERCIAAI
jgi:hypothetical protein